MGVMNIILDPSEVAIEGRTELPLEGGGLSIYYEGLDFGDQEIKTYMAEGVFGSRPIDHDWPLRTIKIPLMVRPYGKETFDDVRVKLEAWASAVANDGGGWLKRILPSGRHIFADIVEAKLHLSASWLAENQNIDREATLELQALPDFYGDERTGVTHEGTGDLTFTEQILGDLPARVSSLVVTDSSGVNQLGLAWNVRRKYYSAASTAQWAYNAEALTKLDIAVEETLTGSFGTKVVKHKSLATSWTPILSTNLKAGALLTHQGLVDVWARVYTTSKSPPWLRLIWDVGDSVGPVENVQVRLPGTEAFYLVRLGQINPKTLPFGEQRWQGVVQGRGISGGENISIDRIWFRGCDEGSGVISAPLSPAIGLNAYKARDGFNQAKGALSGKSLDQGGNWTTEGSAKGDFEETGSGLLVRTAKEDSEWRWATPPGGTFSIVAFQTSWEWSRVPPGEELESGLNWGKFCPMVAVSPSILRVNEVNLTYQWQPNTRYTFTLLITEGAAAAWITTNGEMPTGDPLIVSPGISGGPRQPLLYERYTGKEAITRTYDNFSIWVPSFDAVMFGSKDVRLSTLGMYRKSSDGKGYGVVAYPGSDIPRLPVSGPKEQPVEISLKQSRGNFGALADSGKDKMVAQLSYRPCFSGVPSS